jgi:peroxiredoxin
MRASRFGNSLALAILILLLSVCAATDAADVDPYAAFQVTHPKQRLPAPDIDLATLDDGRFRLSDYRGKVVLINFWATWCAPCRREMPGMERLWRHFQDKGLVIVGISADTGKHSEIAKFVDKLKLSFPIALDPDGQVRTIYEVTGLPFSYLIGRDGRISGRIIGVRDWEESEAVDLIELLLGREVD